MRERHISSLGVRYATSQSVVSDSQTFDLGQHTLEIIGKRVMLTDTTHQVELVELDKAEAYRLYSALQGWFREETQNDQSLVTSEE